MADYQYIQNTGVILPDTSDILTTVQNEYKTAFGDDLVVDPSTPQGVLITAETLARDAVVRNNAALANQINPNEAGGVFLDAIWALTGGQRTKATRSTVTATLTGVPGAIVSAGSRASVGAGGEEFELISTVVIGSDGSVSGNFQSVNFGPVAAPVGDLNSIVTPILGWESISNPGSAVLGTETQSDVAARRARRNTLALQGVSLPEAITSAVYAVEGVKSISFRENVTSSTATIDGVSMVPHSIYVCVDGGTDQNIAMALLSNKSLGAGWNGNVSVSVVEPASGQPYTVKFARPTLIPIIIRATVKVGSVTGDPAQLIRDSILEYVNGEMDGEDGWTVGAAVSPFELAAAVNRNAAGLFVTNMEVGKQSIGTYSNSTIPISIYEKATTIAGYITVMLA